MLGGLRLANDVYLQIFACCYELLENLRVMMLHVVNDQAQIRSLNAAVYKTVLTYYICKVVICSTPVFPNHQYTNALALINIFFPS